MLCSIPILTKAYLTKAFRLLPLPITNQQKLISLHLKSVLIQIPNSQETEEEIQAYPHSN